MYAVRALVYLALQPAGAEPARVESIAAAQRIPPRFLPQIMATLKSAGMVRSRRGAAGGYALARSPGTISLAEVVGRFEQGILAPERVGDDAIALALHETAARIDGLLRAATIEELAARVTSYVPHYTI